MTPSLVEKLVQLSLTTMARQLEPALADAARRNLGLAATLEHLTDLELAARQNRAIDRRFRLAHLYLKPAIAEFHFAHHKSRQQARQRILQLLELEFVHTGANVILIGNPGTGKTFLAKIIAWQACQANLRVLFTAAMDMLNQLAAAQVDHSLVRKLKTYTEPAVLVCD
jgi:DNA replication protein DnaC